MEQGGGGQVAGEGLVLVDVSRGGERGAVGGRPAQARHATGVAGHSDSSSLTKVVCQRG